MTQPVILLDEPRELEDDYGVQVTLADRDEGYKITVKYFYVKEDGKWVHIRHEVALRENLEESEKA